MLIFHKGHTDTIQVYSVTVMIYVKALQAGHSSQGTSEPITPAPAAPTQLTVPGAPSLYAVNVEGFPAGLNCLESSPNPSYNLIYC